MKAAERTPAVNWISIFPSVRIDFLLHTFIYMYIYILVFKLLLSCFVYTSPSVLTTWIGLLQGGIQNIMVNGLMKKKDCLKRRPGVDYENDYNWVLSVTANIVVALSSNSLFQTTHQIIQTLAKHSKPSHIAYITRNMQTVGWPLADLFGLDNDQLTHTLLDYFTCAWVNIRLPQW